MYLTVSLVSLYLAILQQIHCIPLYSTVFSCIRTYLAVSSCICYIPLHLIVSHRLKNGIWPKILQGRALTGAAVGRDDADASHVKGRSDGLRDGGGDRAAQRRLHRRELLQPASRLELALEHLHQKTEESLDTGGGRVFSLDASFGFLATASASAPALFLGSAHCCCGVSCVI